MLFPMISSLFFLPTLCVCGRWRALPLPKVPHGTITFPDNVHMEFSTKSPQKQWQNPRFIIRRQNQTTGNSSNSRRCKCQELAPLLIRTSQGRNSQEFPALSHGRKKCHHPGTQSLSLCNILFVSKITLFVLDQLVLEALKLGVITRCYYSAGIKLYLVSSPESCRQMRRIIWFHLWKCQTLWVNKIHSIFFCLSILGENRLEIAYKWGVLRERQSICYPLQMHSTATATSVLCERTT